MNDSIIIQLLKEAYRAELEMAENYLADSVWLDGPGARLVAESLDVYVAQELAHAKKLAIRLKQLGVRSPASFQSESPSRILPPHDETDPLAIVEGVLEAERIAVARYEKLIEVCDGNDFSTQEAAIEILADEEKHHALFEKFLIMLKAEKKTKPLNP